MKKQMTLLYVNATNNVLSVLTRAASAAPAKQPGDLTEAEKRTIELQELKELVGAEMSFRHLLQDPPASHVSSDAEFSLKFDDLGLFTTDLDANVMQDPRGFYFSKTEKQVKSYPYIVSAATFPNTSQVEVVLSANITEDTNIWVFIQPTGSSTETPQLVKGSIKLTDALKDRKTIGIVQVTSTSTYTVLALVNGYQPLVFTPTAP
jgi:hypothetical protein